MEERRAHVRTRTYLGAEITFNRRYAKLDCLVRNLSQSGATIEIAQTIGAPDAFELTITRDNVTRIANVVWRSDTHLGVKFSDASVVSIGDARRLRALKEERDALRLKIAMQNQPA